MAALTRALREDRVYLTPGLSIGSLAQRLATPEYRLHEYGCGTHAVGLAAATRQAAGEPRYSQPVGEL